MVKKRNLKQFKRLKTPQVSERTQNRGESNVVSLRERFESNISMIEKMVWQDEKDFTLEVFVNLQNDRVYGKGKKSDTPDQNLVSSKNKVSKKVTFLFYKFFFSKTNLHFSTINYNNLNNSIKKLKITFRALSFKNND